jgi:hypothetical protein
VSRIDILVLRPRHDLKRRSHPASGREPIDGRSTRTLAVFERPLRELAVVEREIRTLISYIKDSKGSGSAAVSINDELLALEVRKAALTAAQP